MDSREKIILPYIKDKDVLDLGVGHITNRFLHKFISNNSKRCVGIELDEERANNLINNGYNVVVGNVETVKLNKKFDVIVAGDLIEHLENLGFFLENVKTHLKSDGVLIISTPNVFSLNRIIGISHSRIPFEEHVIWFCQNTLRQLLARHNFYIEDIYFIFTDDASFFKKIFRDASTLFFPELKSDFIVIARMKDEHIN